MIPVAPLRAIVLCAFSPPMCAEVVGTGDGSMNHRMTGHELEMSNRLQSRSQDSAQSNQEDDDASGVGKEHFMRREVMASNHAPAPALDDKADIEASTYSGAFKSARSLFGYESPLPDPAFKPAAVAKFVKLPPVFDFHVTEQIELWNEFVVNKYVTNQLFDLLRDHGGMYPDLDRTFLYCFLRHIKPSHVLEIGSGESTNVAKQALTEVRSGGWKCEHIAIEPYRADQVPQGVQVVKKEMQELGYDLFDALKAGDLLFIDSSHVIMPYGDTLTELVSILPRLEKGVYVHIHDIFLPDDYPPNWSMKNYVYTEQWAVALLLSGSKDWKVVWSSHLMAQNYHRFVLNMPSYPLNLGQAAPNGGALIIEKLSGPVRI